MPEIPEMEHYKELLAKTVVGKPIQQISVERPKSINLAASDFITELSGKIIEAVSRRAKYIVLQLQGGSYLVTHMMLDGRLYYGPSALHTSASDGLNMFPPATEDPNLLPPETEEQIQPQLKNLLPGKPEVILNFSDGTSLYFCDLRLGFLHLLNEEELERLYSKLGVEPLEPTFSLDSFADLLTGRRGAIKPLLMEQKYVCGIGNAYSNEILFASGILPNRKVPTLRPKEVGTLWETIPRVLWTGIRNGGYIEEPFASWDTTTGGQNAAFQVYDRGGQPCLVCGTTITAAKLQGRWAYYCTVCQK